MSATYDAVGPSAAGAKAIAGNASPLTWTHVCTGSQLALFVGIHVGRSTTDSGITITGVTYNGVSLTFIGRRHANDSTSGYGELWVLDAPASGSHTVSVSFSGTLAGTDVVGGGSVSATSVDQATAYDGFVSAAGSGTAPSVVVSSRVGDLVLDLCVTGTGITSSSQTSRWTDNVNSGSGAGNAGQSTAAGATSVTMGYTVTSDWWAILGVNIRGATAPAVPASSGAIDGRPLDSLGIDRSYAVSGAGTVSGTVQASIPILTLASQGTVAINGVVSRTLPILTMASAGQSTIAGVVAKMLPILTVASAGSVSITGSVSKTLPILTLAATGTVPIVGTQTPSIPILTMVSAGSVTVTGALSRTLPILTLAMSSTGIGGTVAAALPILTMASAGSVAVSGSLATPLPMLLADLLGNVAELPNTGVLAAPLPMFSMRADDHHDVVLTASLRVVPFVTGSFAVTPTTTAALAVKPAMSGALTIRPQTNG